MLHKNFSRHTKISLLLVTTVALLLFNGDNAYAAITSAPILTVTLTQNNANLSWTASTFGGLTASVTYDVERSLTGAFGGEETIIFTTGIGVLTFQDTDIAYNTTYFYRIVPVADDSGRDVAFASNIVSVRAAFGNDSCSGDCTAPTMGLSKKGGQIVTDGFSYNYKAVNVDRWHTEYPLIVVETGKTNVLQVKIYDDQGINNIRAIRVAFGVPEIGQLYNGETIVEYNPNGIIGPQVNVIDKNNLLDNVEIKTWTTSCNDSETSPDCLMFWMEHIFREAPLANVVGISVSDKSRNGAQFYFNDGIGVEGDSLNPPQTATIPLQARPGGIIQLTQIDRANEVWVDEQNNIWTKNSYDTWFKITPDAAIKIDVDPISKQGIQRNHAYFEAYKVGQELLANQVWNSDQIQAELPNYITIEYSGQYRMDNLELQKSITEQIKIAQEIFEKEFGKVTSE